MWHSILHQSYKDMELSNTNSAPPPPVSHFIHFPDSSVWSGPSVFTPYGVFSAAGRCWTCLCQCPKSSFSASHLAWLPAETRPLSSCPTLLGERRCSPRGLWGVPPAHTHGQTRRKMQQQAQTQSTSTQADTRDHTDAHTALPSATWV
jgi:hypothetical protein